MDENQMDELLQKKLDLALDIHAKQLTGSVSEMQSKVEALSTELAELKKKVRDMEMNGVQAPAQAPPQPTLQQATAAPAQAAPRNPRSDTNADVSIEKHFYFGNK